MRALALPTEDRVLRLGAGLTGAVFLPSAGLAPTSPASTWPCSEPSAASARTPIVAGATARRASPSAGLAAFAAAARPPLRQIKAKLGCD